MISDYFLFSPRPCPGAIPAGVFSLLEFSHSIPRTGKKQTVPIYLDNLIKPEFIRIYKQDFLKVDLFTGALFIHDSNNF